MDKKFEIKAILFENGALAIAAECKGASGSEVITVLREIVSSVSERSCPNEAVQSYFIRKLVNEIQTIRREK
ncbi:MAG: hypothetical protein Q4D37_11305 [Oscillospiraceae bacterium]|nr:hypothetical protein [Oscillospiraceae bacterium]